MCDFYENDNVNEDDDDQSLNIPIIHQNLSQNFITSPILKIKNIDHSIDLFAKVLYASSIVSLCIIKREKREKVNHETNDETEYFHHLQITNLLQNQLFSSLVMSNTTVTAKVYDDKS